MSGIHGEILLFQEANHTSYKSQRCEPPLFTVNERPKPTEPPPHKAANDTHPHSSLWWVPASGGSHLPLNQAIGMRERGSVIV